MYQLIFDKKALHNLNKLNREIKQRIWDKLQLCKENPFRYLEHLEQIPGFKLRVGNYRVIIEIDNKERIININKVGHRKNIYER